MATAVALVLPFAVNGGALAIAAAARLGRLAGPGWTLAGRSWRRLSVSCCSG